MSTVAVWSALAFSFILTLSNIPRLIEASNCSDLWLDCGNGKCVAYMWRCDKDNDCGNNKDEENCDSGIPPKACLPSQFQCVSDGHCISDTWHCDGEHDCEDGSDEKNCINDTHCHGFRCKDNHCIPEAWKCDGRIDCPDGSDEDDQCPKNKLCAITEFTCSSGTCLDRNLVCDGKKDCPDASDEGKNCSDVCAVRTCSQKCRQTPKGPECFCNDGYTLGADNKTCTDVDECATEGTCSQLCTNLIGSYKCTCMDGYELDNLTCKASGPEPLLIFSTLQEIRAIYLRTKRYFLVQRAVYKAAAVDADPLESRIYWVEISNKSAVYSSKIDGTGFSEVLTNGLMIPEDVAVDYVARNLYFTDSGLKHILACKIEGTMCHVLHSSNIIKPRAIAVDPPEGYVYWSDWGDNSSGIYRSGMDGSRRNVLVSKDIMWPNGITIDHTTNRLFWTDAHLQTIEYITLDGRTRRVLLKEDIFHPYSVAVFEDSLYWSDWNTYSLETCNKFTAHRMNVMTRENGKHIMGVHVYHPVQARKVSNPCWSNTCSHMCLIAPLNTFKCACPPGFSLSANGRTCLIDETYPMLLVNDESRIYHVRPESVGSEAMTELPITHIDMIGRLAYDWKSKTLFVVDMKSPAIYSINMTTLMRKELVKNHLVSPEDIAFDWKSENLYWVDSSKGTVEVISPATFQTATVIVDLRKPVAIALVPNTGQMFISTTGEESFVAMYDMDGSNKVILNTLTNSAISLAVHPSASLLYWVDPKMEQISYLDYQKPRSEPVLLKSRLGNVMSIAVSDNYLYWTDSKNHVLSFMKHNSTISHTMALPDLRNHIASRKVLFTKLPHIISSRSMGISCSMSNGGCSHLCLTSQKGKSCTCPTGMVLSKDEVTCINKECTADEFHCKTTKKCIPVDFVCDGFKDCDDGTDEVCDEPTKRCPGNDFKCANGRCILFNWKCDGRDDCGDNSDEVGCPVITSCAKDQFSCGKGECIPSLWRCDGENDCNDTSDELNCHTTACDLETQLRCDHGQCIPRSWACDGTPDCFDSTDEKNCTNKIKTCSLNEFRCGNQTCIDKKLVCDQRNDCEDGSDEKNCSHTTVKCQEGRHLCKDGLCLYSHEVCDGHKDCDDGGDELNCTQTAAQCSSEEFFCTNNSRCISRRWICDGDNDCGDSADEDPVNCTSRVKPTLPPHRSKLACEVFFCQWSGECIPWSKLCDGHNDCGDATDEGPLCAKACIDNGGCSQKCMKTPEGTKCSCFNGYKLLQDKFTCDDIDECSIPGSCSHFCNNTRGGFKCSCADGYFKAHDHRTCKADGGPASLVYLLPDQIRGIDLSSHSTRVYLSDNISDMRGIDYDASDAIFFWSDWKHGTINSYTPNTNKRDVLLTSTIRPHYLRWDWIVRNLYYTDDEGTIMACDVTGKFCTTIIQNAAPHLNSFDISPRSGFMFWTVWSAILHTSSGVIERADMDGSHRTVIVDKEVIWPSAVTVDHVMNQIYWTDASLNVLECSDFHGLHRRQVLGGKMYNPLSMAIFEDYVYWSDWGSDTLIRCGKFDGKDCIHLHSGNVKAEVIMVVHKVKQPKGVNRCFANKCSHLCLPTSSGSSCKCADSYKLVNSSCQFVPTAAPTYKPKIECPDDYCQRNAKCVVVGGELFCQCPPEYKGDHCETRLAIYGPAPGHDYSWIVGVLLALSVIGCIIGAALLCRKNREKLRKVSENVSVSFRKSGFARKSGRLIVDTDDGGACDELMLGQTGDFKQSSFGNPLFGKKPRALADPESQDGEFKRWPSYDSGDSAFVSESQTREGSEPCVDQNPLGGRKTIDRVAQFFRRS